MLKRQRIKSAVIFLIFIFILPLVILFSKKEEFSDLENRPLEKFPKVSADSIMDRSCMNGIESYLSDHFPFRISCIKGKLRLERLAGRELIGGIYITENRLYEKLPEPDYAEVDKSVEAINDFADDCKGTRVYVMLAPTSSGIYRDRLKPYFDLQDQKSFIGEVYGKFNENVNTINIFDDMYAHRDDYIYYRTDHHWTVKGALFAYKAAAETMGLKAYDNYDFEAASADFRGTFYSKCLYDGVEPDRIDIALPGNGVGAESVVLNDGMGEETAEDIYFREFLDTGDKYCVFLGRNRALTRIRTNAASDKKLLLIKDSYANSFVPFLLQNYSEIAVIDLRYVKKSLTEFADPNDYDQTLFLYNASTFSVDKNVKNIVFR